MMIFNEDVAVIVGVEAAVLFQNIMYWVDTNAANKRNFYDDEYWSYNSAEAFSKQFVFWNKDKVRRLIESLKEHDLIKTGNYNEHKYDRTQWYALTEFGKSFSKITQIHSAKLQNQDGENAEPIPYINTDINNNNKAAEKRQHKKQDKQDSKAAFGDFKNVFLTSDEMQELVSKLGERKALKLIEELSSYIATYGAERKYKNHYATILVWNKRKEEKVAPKEEKKITIGSSEDKYKFV